MSKTKMGVVTIYVILGILNLSVGVMYLTASSILNFVIGAYMLFRAYQEYNENY